MKIKQIIKQNRTYSLIILVSFCIWFTVATIKLFNPSIQVINKIENPLLIIYIVISIVCITLMKKD